MKLSNFLLLSFGSAILLNQLFIYKKIKMTNEELAQGLADAKTQIEKGKGEILAKIESLQGSLGNVSAEVEAAFNDLKTSVQGIDDIVPDGGTVETKA